MSIWLLVREDLIPQGTPLVHQEGINLLQVLQHICQLCVDPLDPHLQ